jgi:hypothetical protein
VTVLSHTLTATWSVYQNRCFQSPGPTLQRRHLALLKSRPGAVPESTHLDQGQPGLCPHAYIESIIRFFAWIRDHPIVDVTYETVAGKRFIKGSTMATATCARDPTALLVWPGRKQFNAQSVRRAHKRSVDESRGAKGIAEVICEVSSDAKSRGCCGTTRSSAGVESSDSPARHALNDSLNHCLVL